MDNDSPFLRSIFSQSGMGSLPTTKSKHSNVYECLLFLVTKNWHVKPRAGHSFLWFLDRKHGFRFQKWSDLGSIYSFTQWSSYPRFLLKMGKETNIDIIIREVGNSHKKICDIWFLKFPRKQAKFAFKQISIQVRHISLCCDICFHIFYDFCCVNLFMLPSYFSYDLHYFSKI